LKRRIGKHAFPVMNKLITNKTLEKRINRLIKSIFGIDDIYLSEKVLMVLEMCKSGDYTRNGEYEQFRKDYFLTKIVKKILTEEELVERALQESLEVLKIEEETQILQAETISFYQDKLKDINNNQTFRSDTIEKSENKEYEDNFSEYEDNFSEYEDNFSEYEDNFSEYEDNFSEYEDYSDNESSEYSESVSEND
jgi:hypothetical protein